MTEPVKPISGKQTQAPAPTPAKPQEPKKVTIGNVTFRADEIDKEKTTTYTKNGKKMNCVFVKPGVRIDYPDQNEPASVRNLDVRKEWYNPDGSNIHINNLHNAKITGCQNRSDYITLEGNSSDNEIFVDQKESWYINGDMRKDRVNLYSSTSNNTVHMDEKDKTIIHYNQTSVYYKDGDGFEKELSSPLGDLQVEGKGESNQEAQLKAALSEHDYRLHKHLQKD